MTIRKKEPGFGESPIVVLSLIVSMASVFIGGIAWIVNYQSTLVTKDELKLAIQEQYQVTGSEFNKIKSQFGSLRYALKLQVLQDTITEKRVEIDSLGGIRPPPKNNRRVQQILDEIDALIEQRKAIIHGTKGDSNLKEEE